MVTGRARVIESMHSVFLDKMMLLVPSIEDSPAGQAQADEPEAAGSPGRAVSATSADGPAPPAVSSARSPREASERESDVPASATEYWIG